MENKIDAKTLFKIGYGLYAVTVNNGKKDNGLIINTVTQITNTPNRVAVTINKSNYSHDIIRETKKLNVNFLSTAAPFEMFKRFGYASGRDVDKFDGIEVFKSDNGLAYFKDYINAFMSLEVENYVDFDTHGMFVCRLTEAKVISDEETMTYSYYLQNVKPKPKADEQKGYICKICGYVYKGDELPKDFICPICKHGADDFEKIN